MSDDLISREALKESMRKSINERYISWTKTITVADIATLIFDEIEYAPTVELDESVIRAVLNKRCMTAVANEYLIALHDKRPHGEWIKHIDDLYPEDSTEECPFCHELTSCSDNADELHYCWNCGAEMRRGDKPWRRHCRSPA